MWVLRPLSFPSLDTRVIYRQETLFTIKLFHGGEFTKFPDVSYKNGVVRYVDKVDIDHFSVHQLDKIIYGLGYKVPPVIYYHFRLPGGDFHFGLRALGNDDDIRNLGQYVKDHKVMRVYTEHGSTNLLTYFMVPKPVKKVVIEELVEEEEVHIPTAKASPPRKTSPVLPSAADVYSPLSISPEYNRKRRWNMVIGLFDCTKQLFEDNNDVESHKNVDAEVNNIGDGDGKKNGTVIFDMTVDEDVHMNVEEDDDGIFDMTVNRTGDGDGNKNGDGSNDMTNVEDAVNMNTDCGVEDELNNSGDVNKNGGGSNDMPNVEDAVNMNTECGVEDELNNSVDGNKNGDGSNDMTNVEDAVHMLVEDEVNNNDNGHIDMDFDIGLYQHILESNDQWEFIHSEGDMGNNESMEEPTAHMEEASGPAIEEESEHEGSDLDSSDESEYWVDEENLIPDIEVDMRDFNMNIDSEVEFLERRVTKHQVSDDDEVVEDLDVIDNDQWDSLGEDSDLDRKRRAVLKELGKETMCSQGIVHKVTFRIGQKYSSKKILKDKIHVHALETRRNLHFVKNDSTRLRAICKGHVPLISGSDDVGVGAPTLQESSNKQSKSKGKSTNKDGPQVLKCGWAIQASRANVDDNWRVKIYFPDHICLPTRKVRSATARFLSKLNMDQVETNPTIPIKALQEQLQKKFNVGFSQHKIFRAKAAAMKHVVGDWVKQYELLRDYIMELQSTNEGTTVKLDLESEPNFANPTRKFKRIYVCLGALKKGFKAGLRDFLGLDGVFMKGPYPGQILTAVGLDSNNGIYPVAYAIVESENTASWKWFLECLGDDLDLSVNSNFTFVSDRQKGIIPAIAAMFPSAEHRFCLRHIYENMRKTWRTKEYKDHLWQCATASTMQEFQHYMREFSQFDNDAYEWLKKIPAHHWARSHFTGRAISDMLLNNLCEVFNSKLIDGRDKPIITCLEYIREYCIKRICNVMKVQAKCVGPLTPNATKILDNNISVAAQYTVRWSGNKYQVQGPWGDQHVVDLVNSHCTCRKWELTGIPCKHVIAALNDRSDNGEQVGQLYSYAHKVHWMKTWKEAYEYRVDPIKGRSMWPTSDCPVIISPPTHHTQPGRPKKKRRLTLEEKRDKANKGAVPSGTEGTGTSQHQGPVGKGKLTRKFISVTCGKCKNKGHNARTCKGQGGNAGAGGSQNAGAGGSENAGAGGSQNAGAGSSEHAGAGGSRNAGAGTGRSAGAGTRGSAGSGTRGRRGIACAGRVSRGGRSGRSRRGGSAGAGTGGSAGVGTGGRGGNVGGN